ncbi:MAG: hypothetical protein UY07_C0018G0016 [Parcubacteria group bacterium GW2011_GWA1_47_8]|nr:MAG: hypothetical protein UY07_C0018G0016 [Parcubacteria group bacterium GW2011_GWA1_47_8]
MRKPRHYFSGAKEAGRRTRPRRGEVWGGILRLRHPNSKKISRVFCEILFLQKLYTFRLLNTKRSKSCESVPHFLTPKNSFGKTKSALVPPPAQKLLGQNTKEKCPFLFRRNWSRANPKSKEHFPLVSAEALRGGGGTDSFVQFPLETLD